MRVIRSFLALKLGLPTIESLTAAQIRLKASCREAGVEVRWVPPPNIHVTLRFLGQITEPMSHAVKDMLEPIVSDMESFELETTGLGVFPNTQRPRVIWAGIGQGSDILEELYASTYSRLLTAGFNFEDKPFTPHVTLGRIKSAPPEVIASCLNENESTDFGISTVRHFFCYQSDLRPEGAEYTAQWVLPFKRKPAFRPAPATTETAASAPRSSETEPVHPNTNDTDNPKRESDQ